MAATPNFIWVFHGMGGRLTSGVFASKELAEEFIRKHLLTGILTKYPLNIGAYDWAIQEGYFVSDTLKHSTPEFIQAFTTASQEHFHYESGNLD